MCATKTVASEVPFEKLCKLCESISSKQGVDKKRRQFNQFVVKWKEFHAKLHGNDTTTEDSFYSAMRLILPQFDKERGSYGIKETKLGRIYVKILGLNKESPDAKRLLNYKTKNTSGDFACVAYSVLQSRCPTQGSFSIKDVNDCLDLIAASNAANDQESVSKHVTRLLRNTSAMEQKWLIRMILKELRMGFTDNTILNTYHPDGQQLYNFTTDLAKVCRMLKNPAVRLHELEVELFVPFRPMLADRVNLNKIEKVMDNKPFYIEEKLDGERMQIHKAGNDYKYFSRNGNELTDNFGASPQDGSLTKHIARSFKPNVNSVILDGEMIPFNTITKFNGSKGQNIDVKSLKDGGMYQPCFYAFDILMFNGVVLTTRPLVERLQYLDNVFDQVEGRIHMTQREIDAKSRKDVVEALNIAIDLRLEGIVVKCPTSEYKPNARKGGWVKVKPEYIDGLMDELDLLIIGGYQGERNGVRIISQFLLGVAAPPQIQGEHPTVFYSLGRVGSGCSMQELYELQQKLSPYWKAYDKRRPPAYMILASGHRERPDVWVPPSKSCIVQVKAAEITTSDKFKTGCTLRFPRVEKVRYDKEWHNCMTLTELEEMKTKAAGKLASRHFVDGDENADEPPKKKRIVRSNETKLTLAPHMQGLDPKSVTHRVTTLFANKEICILNGTRSHSKQDLEKIILENGGSIVKNLGENTYCVVASKETLHVTNIIRSNSIDVVKAEWVLRCINQNEFLDWHPSDLIHKLPVTKLRLEESFDKFGDGFTHEATVDSLKAVFANIDAKDVCSLTHEDIAELELKYNFPSKLFRTARIYLDKYAVIGDPSSRINASKLDILQCDLQAHGADITVDLDNATHVIVHSENTERLDELRLINRRKTRKFHLVTHDWATYSIHGSKWMRERNFQA